jgi:hypothetical protein
MRKLIISAMLLFFIHAASSYGQENFKVIKVNGTIMLKAKGTSLETGTVFSEKEDLLFRTEDATAAVINSQKGRLILTSKNHDLASASSNYLPAMYNIASRGISVITRFPDLQNYFSGKYCVLGIQKVVIGSSEFPMNKENFFFMRYTYKGEEINKKLDYSNDTLVIDKSKLYTIDGKPISGPDNTYVNLYYRKGSESLLINKFELIFPDENQLSKEIKVILEEFRNKTEKENLNEISSYIGENYGKITQDNLISWLDGKNLLKKR